MLLSNSRIEKGIGIKFYEQDILLDDQIYTGDIQININVDYVRPGVGIALVQNEGTLSNISSANAYLVRLGNLECSLIKKTGAKIQVLHSTSVINIKPYFKNLKIEVKLSAGEVYFYANKNLLFKYQIPETLDNYNIGYYSSADNTLNSITIASQVPSGWIVNLNNTNGGYINFSENKFEIFNCSSDAEIEQLKIPLKCDAGEEKTFFVGYEREGENNDIEAYIFYSNDNRIISNKEKNIMKNRKFTIKKDCEVNLKFIGTKGAIKNISISENNNDFFVGTSYTSEEINGSYIKIKADKTAIDKIELSTVIYGLPSAEDRKHILYKDYSKKYTVNDLDLILDKRYNILINLELDKLIINEIIHDACITDEILMFDNMDVIIDKLLVYKKDGTITDILLQDTEKIYVPGDINGPIIITGDDGVPLDISSSYRISELSNNNIYTFTNVEREVFEPFNLITVSNKISKNLDTVIVYGVLKESNIDKDRLLISNGVGIDCNINEYCDAYDTLREDDLCKVDKNTGAIIICDYGDKYIQNKYKEIIIDYLKEDSYAINYIYELGSYEIDISTNKNIKLYYDAIGEEDSAENQIINSNGYKLINVDMLSNSYIVLKMR